MGGIVEFDTGADGWYGAVEAGWSRPTGRDSFLRAHAGASAVSDFYGRSGMNDLYARLAWTYGFNRSVAITPFVGTSITLDSAASTRLYAGLWFEVKTRCRCACLRHPTPRGCATGSRPERSPGPSLWRVARTGTPRPPSGQYPTL